MPRPPRSRLPIPLSLIVSFIMGGMTIFYAFFTGTSTAQTILREDEDGTLPRLFTTPTTQATVLGGKFLAVGLTVLVQMTVLLILGRLIFAIQWGSLLPLALVTLGTVLAAATFGIFIMSLLKSTRQAGTVLGGVLTVTGMLGMVKIFTMGSPTSPAWADIASMFVPQGWAVRGLQPGDERRLHQRHPADLPGAAWHERRLLPDRRPALPEALRLTSPHPLPHPCPSPKGRGGEKTMNRIFDITLKDLMQILRNRMTFLFLLIMPIAFTLLFGLAFGGSGQTSRHPPAGRLSGPGRRRHQPQTANAAGRFHRHPPGHNTRPQLKPTWPSWSAAANWPPPWSSRPDTASPSATAAR